MEQIARERLAAVFAAIRQAIEAEKTYLSELDGPIGDADHGTTMALGFRAVDRALASLEDASPSRMFSEAAMAFLDAVGASTGPLYATGFRRAAQRLEGRGAFGPEEEVLTLEAIAAGIAARGKAQRGDKTMLDVWAPAAEAATASLAAGEPAAEFWKAVSTAAHAGAAATATMIAAKGRAARLRERSLGALDPGAVSAAALVEAMAAALCRA